LLNSELISELCRRIKETRIAMRLSQIELAERAQVGIATIKRVEMGEAVTLSTLIGILRGLLFNRFCNQSQVSLLKSGTVRYGAS
jgi:transcriptional regulator with XRE-family HTH domain